MADREKVIKGLECCMKWTGEPDTATCHCSDCSYTNMDILGQRCLIDLINDALALLKEQELPTELKQKMWNALYAEEDEYEKKFVGKEEHLNWFTVYRPWLQKGFDIAINAIADWEGR